jgi:peptidoglycan/xylan/chitin deacetylase (PgdA/CDA1 family)
MRLQVAPFLRSLAIALVAVLATGDVVVGDTSVRHGGRPGPHRLVDSASRPGVECGYDPITSALTAVRVFPPVMLAVDRSDSVDRQWVAAEARLQRSRSRSNGTPSWVTTRRAILAPAVATDQESPFTDDVRFNGVPPGRYRVRWMLSWYGADQRTERTGRAVHEADFHELRLGRTLTVKVREGWCVSSLAERASLLVKHGPRTARRIALTFDLGGRRGDAVEIAEWLVEHRVPATVFTTGISAIGTATGRRIMALAAAHPEVLLVGNHSWDHKTFTRLTADEITEQLAATEDAIRRLTHATSKPIFRPPYGAVDRDVLRAVGRAGWAITVKWDVVTTDYLAPGDGGPTTAELVEQVLSRAKRGSIVVMHLGGHRTLAALPLIVAGLQELRLRPVTIRDLIGW